MGQFRAVLVVLVIAGALGWLTMISSAQQRWSTAPLYLNYTVIHDEQSASEIRVSVPKDRKHKGWVTLVPSLGRGVRDFVSDFDATLADDLAKRGFSVLMIEPRGIGYSAGSLDPTTTTMAMLADDLDQVFDHLDIEQIALVGHAFGNRLSRYYTAQNPDRVSALVLLAAGGDFELSERQQECLLGSFSLDAPEDIRREHVACAFFAEGNDPQVWLEGWYPQTALAQIAAARSVQSDEFKRAGGKPFLLVQPTEDFIAPPDLAGRALKEELGEQVTYVEIEGAGHALLPEQPDKVSKIVGAYLEEVIGRSEAE
jgi:pimeloyl-ACP methyl ester carboxylesterase